MSIPKFDPKELKVVREQPAFGGESVPIFDYPVSQKEAFRALLERRPVWEISYLEQQMFCPRVNPDNIARSFVFEARAMDPNDGGGPDMFGIEWEYIPMARGSMVRPGKPFIEDASELPEKIVFPDLDTWDWEGAAEANRDYLTDEKFNVAWVLNGWYERLISFMDFEGAIMALFDEDQADYVKDFFDKLSDFYIDMLGRYIKYFPRLDAFCIHDDWGSQKETFFSPAVAEEMIVPYMRRVTDFLHSQGKFCELHSCGQALKQIPNFIAAGWDFWSGQPMNDMAKIHELYGDRILAGQYFRELDPRGKSEEEQRRLAREFARRYCDPKKPTIINAAEQIQGIPRAFREELYIQSRKRYAGE